MTKLKSRLGWDKPYSYTPGPPEHPIKPAKKRKARESEKHRWLDWLKVLFWGCMIVGGSLALHAMVGNV